MRILDNLDIKFLNKNIVILLAFGIIFFLSIDLRLYNLSKVYTEYDDIGVLALHKGVVSSREVEGDFGVFKKTFVFDKETLQNLEKSYLFPFYIAWGWSYSPGQYALYPMVLSDDDSYEMKVFKGRFLSAAASIITVLLLFGIFISLNNGLSWAALLPVSIFSFSQNSILYAHHMGPYSTYCLSTALGLVLIYLTDKKKISTYTGCLLNTGLLYFSYVNVLIFIPLLYIEYHRENLKAFILSYFLNKRFLLFINLSLLFPILLILYNQSILNKGLPSLWGVRIPQGNDFLTLLSIPFYVLKQFFVASKSLFSGFFPTTSPVLVMIFCFLLLLIAVYLVICKKKPFQKVFLSALVLYFLQWLSLYMFSSLTLDETKHPLIFFPVLLSIVFICLNYFKIPNLLYIILCLVAVPYSYFDAKFLIDKKTNRLSFEFIEKQGVEHIFLYDGTLSPLLFFENKRKVFNVDMESFIKSYKTFKMPQEFLMVSQNRPLNLYAQTLQQRFPEIFKKYNIIPLRETTTDQYFPYNNYNVGSAQNGFYVYRFSKKNITRG